MFVAKDKEAIRNPWLSTCKGKWVWGSSRDAAFRFETETEALETGRAAMPPDMEDRVVAEDE